MHNPERRAMRISLVAAVMGLVMAVSQFVFDVDVSRGGGALLLVGIWLFFSGMVVALLFRGRAIVLDRLVLGNEALVHWKYDSETWAKFRRVDLAALTLEMKQMYMLVLLISAAICGVLFIAVSEARWVFPTVFLLINVMTGLAAILRIRSARGSGVERVHEVFIGRRGAAVDGSFHLWSGRAARLDRVEFAEGEISLMIIRYSVLSRYNWQSATLRIPIPTGQEKEAMRVAGDIAGSNHA